MSEVNVLKSIRRAGYFLLFLALGFNPLFVDYVFESSGKIDFVWLYVGLWVIDIVFLLSALVFLAGAKKIYKFFANKKDRFNTYLFFVVLGFCFFFIWGVFFALEIKLNVKENNWLQFYGKFDEELGWVPMESSVNFGTLGQKFSTNSLGFRSPEVDHSKKHIVLVGDSVVWGINVSDEETSSYFLQELLDQNSYSDYQVVNLGVAGYSVDQYYLYLKRHLPNLNDEVVFLVFYTGNDVDGTGRNYMGREKPIFKKEKDDIVLDKDKINRYSCINLVWSSRIINNVFDSKFWFADAVSNLCGRINYDLLDAVYVAKHVVYKINEMVQSNLVYVISPSLYDFKEKSSQLESFEDFFGEHAYSYINNFEIISALESDTQELYSDSAHYSASGNRLLAQTLFDYLVANNLLDGE